MLDTHEYEVEFIDGSTEAYTANIVTEVMYSQVNEEGNSHVMLNEIIDHHKNKAAVSHDDVYVPSRSGCISQRHMTKGWEMNVLWKDGMSDWVSLRDMKESFPIQTAEYAVANKLVEEPTFAWWIKDILKKRDRILGKVKTRYWKHTHKYGLELPKMVKEALEIDRQMGTDFWRKAIKKEMKNVMPAFQFTEDGKILIRYKHIDCHMIFDIKMDLTQKARLVAGGHQTDPPKESVYSSIISKDSVRIILMIAALNDLDILAADMQNAYLNALMKEKVYMMAGLEFGPSRVGLLVIIIHALYGLKSSGAQWHDHMVKTLREANFECSKADPDVWFQAAMKADGFKYYEYVLVYIDDILAVSGNPKVIMDYLESKYMLKKDLIKEPDSYLGAKIFKWCIDGVKDEEKLQWAMSAKGYLKLVLKDVEATLDEVGKKLPSKASMPFT